MKPSEYHYGTWNLPNTITVHETFRIPLRSMKPFEYHYGTWNLPNTITVHETFRKPLRYMKPSEYHYGTWSLPNTQLNSILLGTCTLCTGTPLYYKVHVITPVYSQECNARKVNCSCVYSAYILKTVPWLIMWKMDPMSGFDIRLVFTLPPSDITLQYKKCVHLWNNFPCITSLSTTR